MSLYVCCDCHLCAYFEAGRATEPDECPETRLVRMFFVSLCMYVYVYVCVCVYVLLSIFLHGSQNSTSAYETR
jgi:hypothetical protein